MIGIYKITNLIDNKCYVGQSRDIQKRFAVHRRTAFNQNSSNYNLPLYRAIRKYGLDNFTFEVLEECKIDELDQKEIYYISLYNSYGECGYNLTIGGNQAPHYNKLSDSLVDEIIERLKTSLDNSETIGQDFGVTGRTIRGINSGECCLRDTETYPIRNKLSTHPNEDCVDKITSCEICGVEITNNARYCLKCIHKVQRHVADRPSKIDLAISIKENGFAATGRMFGVTGNTIKKWCKSYNIPHLRKDIILWYNNQMGVENDLQSNKKEKTIQDKPVKQIDLNTNKVLQIFKSENDAAHSLGKKKGNHIGEVCNGIHKSAYGYGWEYA